MKKFWIAMAAALALVGCRGAEEKPAAAAPAAKAEARDPNVIELDEKAVREAGIQWAAVVERPLEQTLEAVARLTPNENATFRVGAVTEGRISHIDANVGDRVKAGQVLADMHSHDIHESRASYQRSLGELNRLRSNLTYAQRHRDRMRRLYELKAASLEQADSAESEFKNATTAVAQGEIEVERTKRHLTEFLEIPVEMPKGEDHDHIPIKAPAAGVVVKRDITLGSVVTPSADLFLISDLSSIWAIASVQEEELTKLRVGMPARVFVQAYGERPFLGRVARIGEALDAATRTVSVRVEVPNAGGQLKPEMYATVELAIGGGEAALLAPSAAPQDINGQTVVFVRRADGKFEMRPVETGRALEGMVVVKRGLKRGEEVVSAGSFVLKSQRLRASLGEE